MQIGPRTRAAMLLIGICFLAARFGAAQSDALTPLQREIENQRQRLASPDREERRDALMKLGALQRAEASRVATGALNDAEPVVRATAAHAIVFLPPSEAAALLIPLLQDKSEFVRREVANALGETRSPTAVTSLTTVLLNDKETSVRAAAAIALGEIRDPSAISTLVQAIGESAPRKKTQQYEFVRREAVAALGSIGGSSVVQPLISVLTNDSNSFEIRRAAATALGMAGDKSAVPALQTAFHSADPYLSEAAREALRRIRQGTR